jgi:hypothetical protein
MHPVIADPAGWQEIFCTPLLRSNTAPYRLRARRIG